MKPRRWNRRDPYAPRPHHPGYRATVRFRRLLWVAALMALVVVGAAARGTL
jgi:hypothetical protein